MLEGREQTTPYVPGEVSSHPFASLAELEQFLRYAAGVELAVIQEYLTAAFSLRLPNQLPQALRDDVTAARAELMRVTIGEMHHLRAVNDVLRMLGSAVPFRPALQVASELPTGLPSGVRELSFRPLMPQTLEDFIAIEQPSVSVDGIYTRILATLERLGTDNERQAIRTIMAEGEDHYQTFLFIREWLKGHEPAQYLIGMALQAPPSNHPAHVTLQQRYRQLLVLLHDGYSTGVPAGAPNINAARNAMLGSNGLDGAAVAVASAGFLVTFDRISDDSRFAPIAKP